MLIRKGNQIKESEITDPQVFRERRKFLGQVSSAALGVTAGTLFPGWLGVRDARAVVRLDEYRKSGFRVDGPITEKSEFISFNNFYEFGFDKETPAVAAAAFKSEPWSVDVLGEVDRPGIYHLEDLIKSTELEERVYRFRCVEAWSAVVPWIGVPLSSLIKRFEPTSNANFVQFATVFNPAQMPGQRTDRLQWPYREALRMDEALNPLALMAVGLYGEVLPPQNGAPIRLVVPWKYGFKSIKSIVRIRFTAKKPLTTWFSTNPEEYGFYGNVNPVVHHPRWSQANERPLGTGGRKKTLLFNGYADEVADLYAGMDLRKNY